MKLKVLFRTIAFPFLFAGVILWPPADKVTIRLILLAGFTVWILIRFFSNRRLYLTGFSFADRMVEVKFITSQLAAKKLQFQVDDIGGMQLAKADFPYAYTDALRLYAQVQWYTFLILEKKTYAAVEQVTIAAKARLTP